MKINMAPTKNHLLEKENDLNQASIVGETSG